MLIALLHTFAAFAATETCTLPRSNAELSEVALGAESAWGRDPQAFAEAVLAVDAALACVIEAVPVDQAARIHRLHGLAAFLRRDTAAATAAFAAARAAEPSFAFPETMVPAGNPVDTLYRNALGPTELSRFEPPRSGWKLHIDGTPATARNDERPAVVQVVDPVGRIREGAWVAEHTPLPNYPSWRDGLRTPLLIAGAGAVLAGAGLWGFGAVTRPDPASLETLDDGEAAEFRQAAIGGTAVGLAGIGLGTVAIGFGVGRW